MSQSLYDQIVDQVKNISEGKKEYDAIFTDRKGFTRTMKVRMPPPPEYSFAEMEPIQASAGPIGYCEMIPIKKVDFYISRFHNGVFEYRQIENLQNKARGF